MFETICKILSCSPEDIYGLEPIKVGLTNESYEFFCRGQHYVFRQPGKGTEQFINRESEAFSEIVAKQLGLDDAMIAIDPVEGWKLSRYVEDYSYIDPENAEDREIAMQTLRLLHDSGFNSRWDFDYSEQTVIMSGLVDCSEYSETQIKMQNLASKLKENGYETKLCHNDAWAWNMLKGKDGRITLIDWEYSGNSYPAADVAYFTGSYDSDDEDYMNLAEIYEGHRLSKEEKWYYFAVMAIVFWYWFVWALYKEANGKTIDDKKAWYDKAIHAFEMTEDLQ